MTLKMQGLDHPALAVSDVDKMADWCRDILGYTAKAGTPGQVWLMQAPDGTYLEIMRQNADPRPARQNLTPGFSHLALRVENLQAAIVELDMRDVKWTGEIVDAVGGGQLRNFEDPDGNTWQVVQRT